jgi:chromosome segregation ATPase
MGEMHALQQIRLKLAEEVATKAEQVAAVQEARTKVEREAKATRDDLQKAKGEISRLSSRIDSGEKDRADLVKQIGEAQMEMAKLKSAVGAAEKDLGRELLHGKEAERTAQRLGREKTAAEKKAASEAGRVADVKTELESLGGSLATLEADNRRMALDMNKMKTVVGVMERERERFKQEIEDLGKQMADHEEDVRVRDVQMKEMEKREDELSRKLKSSQAMYEAMRAERNLSSKALGETHDEIGELKRKAKVQANQIDQLKEDIHNKDKALVAEQFESASLSKRMEQRGHEVEQLRRLLDDASSNVEKQESEIRQLNLAIRRMDSEALAQKRAFDQVVEERDIISQQLTRRNDELALLHEKLSIMTTMSSTGEQAYNQRLDDIRLLKNKVADLMRQLLILQDGRATGADGLKTEAARMQRELLAEQGKVRALSEELENPLNVHRWRKLEGTDPAAADVLAKVRTLQRRLIAKTEQVVERDIALAARDREVADLKGRIAAIPEDSVTAQLAVTQQVLAERTRQVKALASEVTLAQSQVGEYKFDLERTQREVFELKKAAYEGSRRAAVAMSAASASSGGGAGMGSSKGGAAGGGGGAGAGGSTATAPPGPSLSPAVVNVGPSAFLGGGPTSGNEFQDRAMERQRRDAHGSSARFVGGGFNVQA